MSAAVRPLREDEYPAFVARAKQFYVTDMVAAGVDEDVARAKSETDFRSLLPRGLESEGHLLYAIDDDGRAAGYLWLAERRGEIGHNLFVYALEIDADRRGRGLGRAGMVFAEDEARKRGIPAVALNVFGGNDAARGLYRSLGYREIAVHMEKRV